MVRDTGLFVDNSGGISPTQRTKTFPAPGVAVSVAVAPAANHALLGLSVPFLTGVTRSW
jgi:hypothetical protein